MRIYSVNLLFIIYFLIAGTPLPCQTIKELYPDKNFDEGKVVATVDSIKITAEEFYLNYEFGPAFTKREKDSKEKHLQYMINEKLLALDGYSRKIDTSEEISSLLTEFKNDIMTEELYKDKVIPLVNVTDPEVNLVIGQKQTELEIKWLFAKDEEGVKKYVQMLSSGLAFDSIFAGQINDTVYYDERYLKTNRYQLGQKNALLASIIDSMKAGDISTPFHIDDGWYIVKLSNYSQNIIVPASEHQKLKQEAVNAVTKIKMDSLSDKYVNDIMESRRPVIKRESFDLVTSYLGKYYLPDEKFKSWQLDMKLKQSIEKIGGANPGTLVLVTLSGDSIIVEEFLTWYRNRSEYTRLPKESLKSFSISVEGLVWRMVRDKLLSNEAKQNDYDKSKEVIKQMNWWRDKIVSSAVRNEIAKSLTLKSGEINKDKSSANSSDSEQLAYEFQKKMLHKILSLKQKYRIEINEEEVRSIRVSQENDPRAIEFYSVKKGGLIPRTPYPTINQEWANWE